MCVRVCGGGGGDNLGIGKNSNFNFNITGILFLFPDVYFHVQVHIASIKQTL